MNKILLVILITIGILILLILGIRFLTPEDTWIKDERGVWIKHGVPRDTPQDVRDQQNLVQKAQEKYQNYKKSAKEATDLSQGPCLGKIADDWVADIAHNPRQNVDDRPENQCQDYLTGSAHHFIELDENGEIIKIQ